MNSSITSEYFEHLRQELLGHRITFTRLAANSLILYVDCQPGDTLGYTIWLEPTWHVKIMSGVLVGSRQAQTEDDAEHESLGERLTALCGQSIVSLAYQPLTYDLELQVGDYSARTFVADPDDAETWHIHDVVRQSRVVGNPRGLEIDTGPTQAASMRAV